MTENRMPRVSSVRKVISGGVRPVGFRTINPRSAERLRFAGKNLCEFFNSGLNYWPILEKISQNTADFRDCARKMGKGWRKPQQP